MADIQLSGEDIVRIIAAGKRADVIQIDIGELKITYGLGKVKEIKGPVPQQNQLPLFTKQEIANDTVSDLDAAPDWDDPLVTDPTRWHEESMKMGSNAHVYDEVIDGEG